MLLVVALSVALWLWLLLGRGGFWRADVRLGAQLRPEAWPEVVALIPARDEAATIRAVLEAHAATAYPGRFSVIVVDDGSVDGTGVIARQVAAAAPRAIHVLAAPALPAGWTGKLWALETGRVAAGRLAPAASYVLLTDADIIHTPETLGRLVAKAEAQGLALVSLMARLDARGLWGGLLVPAFVFFFQKLYPFRWVNDLARRTAAAAGGCVLARREALDTVGGFGAIRNSLIDDCALAARIKHTPPGRAIWLGLAEGEVMSLRDNRRLSTVWAMVARTAFAQLRYSVVLLGVALGGMALAYLAGPLAVLALPAHGDRLAAGLGALAWLMAAAVYVPTVRLYGRAGWQALGLPLAALLYGLMTVHSALAHWRGRGGGWKGRTY